ncbi:MAG: DNA adenine methylase [Candidatus Sericytochromatia bacterium]|nr:DNA adenine methylase [Candidatus Sericytochromatia bacterium]
MIKYLGSKRALLPAVLDALVGDREHPCTVLDLFAGTSRVGHALKRLGHRVVANDHNAYAEVVARCYVAADAEDHAEALPRLLQELEALPGEPGYFTETFCERARFFHPRNGARIDAIRARISEWALPPEREAILLVALMEAADRVDSTTGLQMAYLKHWAPRALGDMRLRLPDVLPRAAGGKGVALRLEAEVAAAIGEVDVAYLDPPYNQHAYHAYYHVWETLVRDDRPEVYGVACKRVDTRERHSLFNSRRGHREALASVLRALRVRDRVVVSFNDEGYMPLADLEAMLGGLWEGTARVQVRTVEHTRYIGARIGIHDPRGRKVGQVGRLRNREHLVIADRPRGLRG